MRTDHSPDTALSKLAALAAALALVALLTGGVGMSMVGGRDTAESLAENAVLHLMAGIGLALVSLFDMATVPALHHTLRRRGPLLVLVATQSALAGDGLGLVARLVQTAEVPLVGGGGAAASALPALVAVEITLNTAGFVLVGVSFASFGALLLRAGSRLGWVAIVASVATLVGQLVPAVFLLANVAFLCWYVGLVLRFRPPSQRVANDTSVPARA